MVILDVVRDYWRDDLAPALSGAGRISPLARLYERHAVRIAADLARGVDQLEPGAGASVDELLECVRRGAVEYEDAPMPIDVLSAHKDRPDMASRGWTHSGCDRTRRKVEPLLLEVLARKVEAHELQHVIDGRSLAPPRELRTAMRGFSDESIDFAAAELSAYLAEIVYSDQPRLTLVHFMAVAGQREWSPEAFAGRVAAQTLQADTMTLDELLGGPEELLRAHAHDAYRTLFSRPLPVMQVRSVTLPRADWRP